MSKIVFQLRWNDKVGLHDLIFGTKEHAQRSAVERYKYERHIADGDDRFFYEWTDSQLHVNGMGVNYAIEERIVL